MNFKRRHLLITVIITLLSIFAFSALHILPLNIFSVQQKPEPELPQIYDHYIIVDEINGQSLMYVPLIVNAGDEVLTEENKRYKVVRVEENRAFARFVEDINLEEYQNSH